MRITNRRAFVTGLAAAPAAGLALSAGEAFAASAPVAVPGFKPELMPPQAEMWGLLRKMQHDFGPRRMCGDDNHIAFVNWLEERFKAIGCTTQRDHYTLKHWTAEMDKDTAASLTVGGATTNLDVLSYFPYSGTTKDTGPVSGPIIYVTVDRPGGVSAAVKAMAATAPANLADSIVVVECPCPLQFNGPEPPTLYGQYPVGFQPSQPRKSPVNNSNGDVGGVYETLDGKCKGILFCWTDISDDGARYQWMPFSQPLHRTPGLWVGHATAAMLKTASRKGGRVTMELRATITPDRPTDTLIALLPGSTDEITAIGTHTDGLNLHEENGSLAVLALATYASRLLKTQRRRTLAFILAAGHMAAGPLHDKETSTGPNGQRGAGADGAGAYRDHPEIVSRTVAALALEHLGGMEWLDDGRAYSPTNQPSKDLWYIGSKEQGAKAPQAALEVMAKATEAAAQGTPPELIRMQVTRVGKISPESRPPMDAGIPAMGLIPITPYLLEASPSGAIERINEDVFYNQMTIAARLMVVIDKLTADELMGRTPVDPAVLNPDTPRGRNGSARRGATKGDGSLPVMAVASLLGLRLRGKDEAASER